MINKSFKSGRIGTNSHIESVRIPNTRINDSVRVDIEQQKALFRARRKIRLPWCVHYPWGDYLIPKSVVTDVLNGLEIKMPGGRSATMRIDTKILNKALRKSRQKVIFSPKQWGHLKTCAGVQGRRPQGKEASAA